jgi:hypothetical protein
MYCRAVLSLPSCLSKRERAMWHAEADRLALNSQSTVGGWAGCRVGREARRLRAHGWVAGCFRLIPHANIIETWTSHHQTALRARASCRIVACRGGQAGTQLTWWVAGRVDGLVCRRLVGRLGGSWAGSGWNVLGTRVVYWLTQPEACKWEWMCS